MSEAPAQRARRWPEWLVPFSLAVAASTAFAAGLLIWGSRDEARTLEDWRRQLSAMAEDRRTTLEQWASARRGDARTIAGYPTSVYLASGRRTAPYPFPQEQGAEAHLVQLLRGAQESYGYQAAWLVGSGPGHPVLARTTPDPPFAGMVARVLERRDAEIDVEARGGRYWVAAAAPVWLPGRPDAAPIAVALLAMDARAPLFGLLGREPVPTRTGESLIARREGDELAFISPLRHGPTTLRLPTQTLGLPAAAALEGRETFGTFTDYRGERVLAAVRPIRSTRWGLVVKIDRAEALASARARLRRTGAAAFGLLAALLGIGFGIWRHQTASARIALVESEARFGLLLEHAGDAILFVRPDGRIVKANGRAEALYGYSRSELEALSIDGLHAPERSDRIDLGAAAARQQPGLVFETEQRAKDGTPLAVELSCRFLEMDREGVVLCIVRDVRERKAAERRIAFLNQTLRTLFEINHLMIREADRERFSSEACRILCEHGGFRMAWIGLRDSETDWIVPQAWAGHEQGFLSEHWFSADASKVHGRTATGIALREDRTVVVADVAAIESPSPWHLAGLERGYRSVCVSPIRMTGRVTGVVALYSEQAGVFEPDVVRLVEELAGDIGFAIESGEARREREAAAAALRESESRFKRLADNAPDVIYRQRLLPTFRTEYVSPGVEALLEYAPEDFYGDPDLLNRVLHPDDKHVLEEAARGELAAGRTVLVRWTRRDGTLVWTEIRNVLVRDEHGTVVALEGIARDATERLLAERTVRRLSAAVEQSPVAIVITDTAGTIEYANPAFSLYSGYSREEAVGQNPRILKSGRHPPEFYASIYAALTQGREWRGEILNRRKDGALYWVSAAISPIVDVEGRARHYLAVTENVTERKAAEEALRKTQEQLAQSQKIEAIGRLAGGVAHDFNNLLGVIIGHGELAHAAASSEPAVQARLEQILGAAHRAGELTRQLLAFSRRQVLQPRILDLNAEVADMEKMLRRLIGEDVELVTRLAPALGRVRADPGQIGQVLMNLAVNARDAMPQGGTLTIETKDVEVDEEYARSHVPIVPGSYVELSVSDDGSGMDESVRDRVFEPFFTTKPEGLGSGLGLSTVYGIVKQSGGYVWVASALGRGTTFTIHLPRQDGAVEQEQAPAAAPPGGGTETILVVEDQDGLRSLICEMLEDAGYRVLSAPAGPTALAASEAYPEPIHLLVTDVVMPGMSGTELAARLRERRPQVRVLLMSGYTSDVIAHDGGGSPERFTLLAKPFTGAALLCRVKEALTTAQA